jgi:alpha-1,6-mannosyltransferase
MIGWCLPVLARRRGVPPERAVWLVLACPLVPIHLISGAHNEAVMIALLLAGLTVAVTGAGVRRMLLAGVLLGLAVGVKATAVVVLPFAVLIFGRKTAAVVVGGGAAAALAAVSFGSGLGLGWVTGLAGSGVSVQWTALPTAIGLTLELTGVDGAVGVTRVVGMVALVVVLIALWVFTLGNGKDPVLYAGLALAATVVLAPVFHPWYALWPLAVLAATVRRETLWLVVPCAVAAALCLPDGYNLALASRAQGAVVMTALAGFLAWKVLHEANRDSRRLGAAHGGDRGPRRDP